MEKNHTNPNDIESKRFSSRCFQGHNLRPRVTVLCMHSAISFFLIVELKKGKFYTKIMESKLWVTMFVYEKTTIYLSREPSRTEKSSHFVHVRALKFCAVGMRNAILRNYLKPRIKFSSSPTIQAKPRSIDTCAFLESVEETTFRTDTISTTR